MNLFEIAKAELTRSNADRRHPFKLFQLATHGLYPEIRTVVKRRFEADFSVLFYTDSRSPKVSQIQENAKVSAHFYHEKKKLQVRLKGIAHIIDERSKQYGIFLNEVKQSPTASDYKSTLPPGTPIEDQSDIDYRPELFFCPIWIISDEVEVLQLHQEQHQRRRYFRKDGVWEEEVLVP